MAKLFLVLLHIFLTFVLTQSAPKGSLVTQLPGFLGSFHSKHYGGYVTLDKNHGKNLYYYFVESERNPSKDPVVLWLNGGPGCSSMDGFIYEHGPFNFEKPVTKGALPRLKRNPYSWSRVSNIIYLDSPAGVGFSYSKNVSDYNTGDEKVAADTHTFLLKWFELYPEFLANPIFIAGESYAGVYVPTLADEIVKGIEAGIKPKLNLKGYLVGNPVTDERFDGNALVPFTHGMGLISDELFEKTTKACNGTFYVENTKTCHNMLLKIDEGYLVGNPVTDEIFDGNYALVPFTHGMGLISDEIFEETTKACNGTFYVINTQTCKDMMKTIYQEIQLLNVYNILEPCYYGDEEEESENLSDSKLPLSFKQLGKSEKSLPIRKRMFGRAWPYRAIVKDGIVPSWPQLSSNLHLSGVPCTDDEVATIWLNNPKVRRAIHAREISVIGEWKLCTDNLQYNHDLGSMIKYHKKLTSKGYRALIYSGDHDMCVPYTGTEAWTRSLGYKIVDEWRTWIYNHQVAGYVQGYANNLTFLTIKGSGHTVPEYKPKEALHFYQHFLDGYPA